MKILHCISILVALLFSFRTDSLFASSPQIRTQAPGFYRMMIGDYEVTTLLDGFFPIKPQELLIQASSKKIHKYLLSSYQDEIVPTSVNAFLINTGARLILIDAGCGAFFGPSFGRMLENLKASGYSPDQVDEIEITHMHTDHLGGIVQAGKAVFPRATIRMDQRDADFWLNLDNARNVKAPMKDMFSNSIAALAPYKSVGQFKPFQGRTEIAPGVIAMPSYGHTPGHTAYLIESRGKKLLLLGDLFHIEAIQFPDPSIAILFDSSPKDAIEQRKKIFKEAATEGFLIGAAHLPFPGIGHVLKAGSAYRYLPRPYGPVQ